MANLKEIVCAANLDLVRQNLVVLTWGNLSAIDRETGRVVIKPSGVPYDKLLPETMAVVSVETGEVVEGKLKPSSDTATHLEIYRAFPEAGSVVHTHSFHATAWAQAGKPIPALGTTHADYFAGAVPCTRPLRAEEIASDYERNTGRVIVETVGKNDPMEVPAILVAGHGPFVWGPTAAKAVENALVLEYVARLAAETFRINSMAQEISRDLLNKHFFRKHGPGAYYGQK